MNQNALAGVLAWAAYLVFPASFAAGFGFITALVVFLPNAVNPDTLATAGRTAAGHAGGPRDADSEGLLLQLDEIVDAANTLAAVLGLEPTGARLTDPDGIVLGASESLPPPAG